MNKVLPSQEELLSRAYQQGREDANISYTDGITDCIKWLYEGCFDARFDKLGASGGDVYSLLDKVYTNGFLDKIVEQIKEKNDSRN